MFAESRIQNNRRSREHLVREIGSDVSSSGSCRCPNPRHTDKHPSAKIQKDAKGVWRILCYACGFKGDYLDVRTVRTRRSLKEVFRAEICNLSR